MKIIQNAYLELHLFSNNTSCSTCNGTMSTCTHIRTIHESYHTYWLAMLHNFVCKNGTAQLQGKTSVSITRVLLASFLRVESQVLTNALATRK